MCSGEKSILKLLETHFHGWTTRVRLSFFSSWMLLDLCFFAASQFSSMVLARPRGEVCWTQRRNSRVRRWKCSHSRAKCFFQMMEKYQMLRWIRKLKLLEQIRREIRNFCEGWTNDEKMADVVNLIFRSTEVSHGVTHLYASWKSRAIDRWVKYLTICSNIPKCEGEILEILNSQLSRSEKLNFSRPFNRLCLYLSGCYLPSKRDGTRNERRRKIA